MGVAAVVDFSPKKTTILDRPKVPKRAFRMQWNSFSVSTARTRSIRKLSSRAANRRKGAALGGLFRINTCKIEELSVLK
ncbi:MAG: hypothetical protein DMG32_06750 [Acidobacteria bacterium]|nr:MAG: hypothetical protein DMG32_06750 [Acidobacteriota bacterium]